MDAIVRWMVISARPGAARGLFVADTILVAAHATLLVFDRVRLSCRTCSFLRFSFSGSQVPAWAIANLPRPGIVALMRVQSAAGRVGQLVFTYHYIATHLHIQTHAINSDLFFFAYGILSCWRSARGVRMPPEELRMA